MVSGKNKKKEINLFFYRQPLHGDKKMVRRNMQDYYCNVIKEDVQIFLKNKANIGLKYQKDIFVKCNQDECQYVDENISPCPLGIEMFTGLRPV